jgi:hypothetical protein
MPWKLETGHQLFQADRADKKIAAFCRMPYWKLEAVLIIFSADPRGQQRSCTKILQRSVGAMEAPSSCAEYVFHRSERPTQIIEERLQHSVGAMEAPSSCAEYVFHRSERPTQIIEERLQHSVGAKSSCAEYVFHRSERPTQIIA